MINRRSYTRFVLALLVAGLPAPGESIHWTARDVDDSVRCFDVTLSRKDWGISKRALDQDSQHTPLEWRVKLGQPEEVLVRRFYGDHREPMPIRKVRLAPHASAVAAKEEEWLGASPPFNCVPRDRLVAYPQRRTLLEYRSTEGQAVVWAGRRFLPSGKEWRHFNNDIICERDCCRDTTREMGPAVLSPNGRFLAIASETIPNLWTARFLDIVPVSGLFLIDIYDVRSGRRLATMAGNFRNWNFATAEGCLWVTDRYFVVPQTFHKDRAFVCEMPPAP